MAGEDFHLHFISKAQTFDIDFQEQAKASPKTVLVNGKNYSLEGDSFKIAWLKSKIPELNSDSNISSTDLKACLHQLGAVDLSVKIYSVARDHIMNVSPSDEKVIVKDFSTEKLRGELKALVPKKAGAIVSIRHNGEELEPLSFGSTSVLEGRELDLDTASMTGSGAKMFTGLLSLVLQKNGILSLDSVLPQFMREEHFKIFKNPEMAKDISLDMLLSHTSGLQYFANDCKNRQGQNLDQIFNEMDEGWVDFVASPGDGVYSYSNHIDLAAIFIEKSYKIHLIRELIDKGSLDGNQTLGSLQSPQGQVENLEHYSDTLAQKTLLELLETKDPYVDGVYVFDLLDQFLSNVQDDATGKHCHEITYDDILKRELLDPLGMDRTSFQKPEDSNLLKAFSQTEGKAPSSSDTEIRDPLMHPAGGLWTTMRDVGKLASGFQDGVLAGKGKDGESIILIDSSGIENLRQVRGVNGNTGLSVAVDGPSFEKGGLFEAYRYQLSVDLETNSSVSMFCNFHGSGQAGEFHERVCEILQEMKSGQLKASKSDSKDEFDFTPVDCPMSACDKVFKGWQGYAGIKDVDGKKILNWNGKIFPLKPLGKGVYESEEGDKIQIVTGPKSGKEYIIFGDIPFQEVGKDSVTFVDDLSFLRSIHDAEGIYHAEKPGWPKFELSIDDKKGFMLKLNGVEGPTPAHISHIERNESGSISEIWLHTMIPGDPPANMLKLKRVGDNWGLSTAPVSSPADENEKEGPVLRRDFSP
ncbi:serine hydrolase [Chlamydiales bacterium]|nr:serine hydrolase [Chlamydiales bacterium]